MTVTGLLVAGGLSRRMGRNKATLEFEGQPLWARQLGLLRELAPEKILVSARTLPAWASPELEVVLDRVPSRGPMSGLAAALGFISTSHLVAVAIDLPLLTAAHLRKLLSLSVPGRGVIPINAGYVEPLAAVYPKEAAGLAERALGSEDVSLRSFAAALVQNRLAIEYAVLPTEQVHYRNLNQPADLQG